MPLKIRKNKSPLFIILLLILTLLTGLTAGYFSALGITENGKFEAFSRKVFQNEVSGSTLTLHYTLAHPEKQGIPRKKATLGTIPTDMKNTYQICSQYGKLGLNAETLFRSFFRKSSRIMENFPGKSFEFSVFRDPKSGKIAGSKAGE